jgi:hypothetical protein
MMAAIGKQLKQSVKVFHSLMLYLRLPVQKIVSVNLDGNGVEERTFIIEAVYPIDASAFMVPSQYEEVFRVFDLVRKE